MDIVKFHKSFLTSRVILIFAFVLFIVLRLLRKEDGDAPALWSATLLQMGIAIYMLYLSQAFVIIRQRSLLPAFFYLLLTGTNPALFFDPIGSIAAFGVTFCLFFLFSTYQNSQSQKEILNIALLIGLISLLWFPVLFLLPLFWYGMYRFKSLNFRTFFAGFAGILIVYLSLFCWSLYKEDLSIFFDKIPDLSSLWSFQSFGFTLKNWLMMGMLFFLLILSGINIFMAGISEKIRTIITLRYLYLFAFIIIILFLLNINWGSEWTLILYIPFSYLFAHYFTLATQKWSSWLFLFTIVFFIGMYFILDSW